MKTIRVKVWNEETKKLSDSMTLQQLLINEHDDGIVEGTLNMPQYGTDNGEKEYSHLKFLLCSERKDITGEYIAEGDIIQELVLCEKWFALIKWNSTNNSFYFDYHGDEIPFDDIFDNTYDTHISIISNILKEPDFFKKKRKIKWKQ